MKRKKWFAGLLCAAMLTLFGCDGKVAPGNIGSEIWDRTAAFTYGTMEYEKLQVLEWNSGRLEATSDYTMVEAENGYYLTRFGLIYYADKSDLSNWVPLCNQPDCDHLNSECNAYFGGNSLAASDGKLYLSSGTARNILPQAVQIYPTVISAAPDGTGRTTAYTLETPSLDLFNTQYSTTDMIYDGAWLFYVGTIDTQGNTVQTLFHVTGEGTQTVFAPENAPSSRHHTASGVFSLRGEDYLYWPAWSRDMLLQFRDGQLVECFNMALIPNCGGYISGDILRGFSSSDGYYDINVATGEKTKLADCRFQCSDSAMLLPNCIVESTLLYRNRQSSTENAMELFDGEQWQTVTLPDEWQDAGKNEYLVILGVSSDSILFCGYNEDTRSGECTIYKITLGTDAPKLEYCGLITRPEEE